MCTIPLSATPVPLRQTPIVPDSRVAGRGVGGSRWHTKGGRSRNPNRLLGCRPRSPRWVGASGWGGGGEAPPGGADHRARLGRGNPTSESVLGNFSVDPDGLEPAPTRIRASLESVSGGASAAAVACLRRRCRARASPRQAPGARAPARIVRIVVLLLLFPDPFMTVKKVGRTRGQTEVVVKKRSNSWSNECNGLRARTSRPAAHKDGTRHRILR